MRRTLVVLCSILVGVGGCGDNDRPASTIGGSVLGLEGAGLVLAVNGTELAVERGGAFQFPVALAFGTDYEVTVVSHPSSPTQACAVENGTGTTDGSDVTDITVRCITGAFTVGGTLSGLSGAGLVLQNNGKDDLEVSANGTFTFATPLLSGTSFAVTVKTQPSGPTQTCVVSGGTGTVGSGDVTTVVIDCAVDRFTVGGQVSGLAGSVVLQNNAGDNITVTANGSFAFPTTVASGAAYDVTILTQPSSPSQTCVVSSGTGTVTNANVTSVRVDCTTNTYSISGTVTGLAGVGLVLQNNAGDNLSISADGSFTFTTPIASGQSYDVSVLTQPSSPTQVCSVTNGNGTVGGADITTVAIECVTSSFTIGGTVTGLSGSGLVLKNNGGDDLSITGNGSFTFTTPIESGTTFAVTVGTQPASPTQTCTVTGGTGSVGANNVTSVAVDCTTNAYSVGGTISGLAGTVVLQNNAGDDLTVTSNGSFAFATPLLSGTSYAVTVLAQPGTPSQTCTITSGGTGTVTSSDVTSVVVACTTNRYTVGGMVTGLAGTGLVLRNNGGDDLPISADGSFTFATSVESGQAYAVTVASQPTNKSQTCLVTNGSGAIGGANVTNVTVTCTTDEFVVSGTVSGLLGSGLVLRNNGGDDLAVNANGTFSFTTKVASGDGYAVSVFAYPTSPWQTCVVGSGSGTVTNADITSVTVTCTTNEYTIGGTVAGLAGSGLVLRNNGGDDLPVNADGSFTFATSLASGTTYAVTVASQPAGPTQTCVVTGGTGTVGGANVASVMVNCMTDRFTISGTVSGLAGTVVLQNNAGDDLSVSANGTFSFTATVASGAPYDVTVLTQPTNPWQTCVVTSGTGTVTNADITDVEVACTTNSYTIGGTVSGLAANQSVVLRQNGADDQVVSADGSFTFSTPVPSGSPYSVTVLTQPSTPIAQTCNVTSGTGTVAGANVTGVIVTCTTNTYTVGGTVSGLTGSGLVLRNNGGDDLPISMDGTFTFTQPIASGATYSVTVGTHPSGQTCTVTNDSGTIGSSGVTDVLVSCGCGSSITYNYTGGLQTFTVPACATSLTVDAYGAEGGTSTGQGGGLNITGGLGARARGTFSVTPGEEITVLVGGRGANSNCGSGGGGGSFVRRTSGLMLVAGGGGGGFHCFVLGSAIGGGGNTGTSGGDGISTNHPTYIRPPAPGGTSGNGGYSAFGGGGGGFLSAGTSTYQAANGGGAYPGAGGVPGGGYGGGGGYYSGCCGGSGGGGGYSGGSGGQSDGCAGGGGGSYNAGTAQTMTAATRAGDGVVTISY